MLKQVSRKDQILAYRHAAGWEVKKRWQAFEETLAAVVWLGQALLWRDQRRLVFLLAVTWVAWANAPRVGTFCDRTSSSSCLRSRSVRLVDASLSRRCVLSTWVCLFSGPTTLGLRFVPLLTNQKGHP